MVKVLCECYRQNQKFLNFYKFFYVVYFRKRFLIVYQNINRFSYMLRFLKKVKVDRKNKVKVKKKKN